MNNELIRMYEKRGTPVRYMGELVELSKPNGEKYTVLRTEDGSSTIPIKRLRTWDNLSVDQRKKYIESEYELLVKDTKFRAYKHDMERELEKALVLLNEEKEYWLNHLDEEAYLK